jgi:hypothetical protein
MVSEDALEELRLLCPEAKVMSEAGLDYVLLPGLKLSTGTETLVVDGLLCPQPRDGYMTRLFLSQQIHGKGNNWKPHQILDKTWYTPSWNNVSSDLRLAQMLVEHLRAYR